MKDPTTWNQLADEIRELRAENDMLRGRKKADKPLVYLAQPYGGKPENYLKAQKLLMIMQETYREYDFISPVAAYGWAYDSFSYQRGIEQCLALLSRCDSLWICYDDGLSKGVKIERDFAIKNNMPIKENAEL